MALLKSIEVNDSGVGANYWNIGRVEWNKREHALWYALEGYVSEAARSAGKAPAGVRAATIPMLGGETGDDYPLARLYEHAKTVVVDFAGAVDA